MHKKTFLLAFATLAILAGCAKPPTPSATENANPWPADKDSIVDGDGLVWHRYTDVPNVQLEYKDKFTGEKLFPLKTTSAADLSDYQPTKISFVEFQKDGSLQDLYQTLEVFGKLANEPIERAIAGILTKNGKDASRCKVESNKENPLIYRIYTAKPVAYSADELRQIAQRKKDYNAERDGPETADYMKRAFDREHLVKLCSSYAEPAGLGTSSSFPAYFIYNPSVNKTTFVFVPPQYDPLVYRNITLTPDN